MAQEKTIILSSCEKVINAELFISSHMAIIQNENVNKKVKQPYIDRLIKFQTLYNQTKDDPQSVDK